jgi:MoxR-like ATPase
LIEEVQKIQDLVRAQGYVTDRAIATTLFLATQLKKPILIEGQSGVGKTEVAKVLSAALGAELIRLQCYEGLDASTALYEWNYPRQMLRIKIEEQEKRTAEAKEAIIFSEEFLLKRPLLRAITNREHSPVLLIDEADRADEEFEAFLMEVLSDFQVTIPELGTIKAEHRPYVVLTSNRTRELSDALKRRCLYLWIGYPDFEKELEIIRNKVPDVPETLAGQIAFFMQGIRRMRLAKTPGVAETLDWTMSLMLLHRDHLDRDVVRETLGALVKDHNDVSSLSNESLDALLIDSANGLDQEKIKDRPEALADLIGRKALGC